MGKALHFCRWGELPMDATHDVQGLLSVIIPTHDQARNVERLVHAVKQVTPGAEMIIVCAGLQPHADDISVSYVWGAKVIAAESNASSSECRAIGAKHATGSVLLFLDERNGLSQACYKKWIAKVQQGYDVVMCADDFGQAKTKPGSVRYAFSFLNQLLGHRQFGSASLEKAPFILNRKALETIDFRALRIPAVALVKAVKKDLAITCEPIERSARKQLPPSQALAKPKSVLFEEHARAIHMLLQDKNERGAMPDGERHRILAQETGLLHLRSVFYQESDDKEADGWGAKRKERTKRIRKRAQRHKRRPH
jgi:hypothetical protein